MRERRGDDGTSFELIFGERRWRASQLAGMTTIKAEVIDLPDDLVVERQIIENVQRHDVDPLDEAFGRARGEGGGEGHEDEGHRQGRAEREAGEEVGEEGRPQVMGDGSPALSEVIAHLGHGKVDEIGGELLQEAIKAVATHSGSGKLVITIDVKEEGGHILLDATFRTKKPHEPIPVTRVWVDNGQLSLFDPDPKVVSFPGPHAGGRGRKGPAS